MEKRQLQILADSYVSTTTFKQFRKNLENFYEDPECNDLLMINVVNKEGFLEIYFASMGNNWNSKKDLLDRFLKCYMAQLNSRYKDELPQISDILKDAFKNVEQFFYFWILSDTINPYSLIKFIEILEIFVRYFGDNLLPELLKLSQKLFRAEYEGQIWFLLLKFNSDIEFTPNLEFYLILNSMDVDSLEKLNEETNKIESILDTGLNSNNASISQLSKKLVKKIM